MRRFPVVLCFLVAGCASTIAQMNGLGTSRVSPSVADDSFSPTVTVYGIDHYLADRQIGQDYIRTIIPRTSALPVFHELYVANQYNGDWRFWESASGQDANPLELVSIARDVVSCRAASSSHDCTLRETFGVMLPDSTLRAHTSGYAVKIYAHNGESMVVTLDSTQVRSQIHITDSVRATLTNRSTTP